MIRPLNNMSFQFDRSMSASEQLDRCIDAYRSRYFMDWKPSGLVPLDLDMNERGTFLAILPSSKHNRRIELGRMPTFSGYRFIIILVELYRVNPCVLETSIEAETTEHERAPVPVNDPDDDVIRFVLIMQKVERWFSFAGREICLTPGFEDLLAEMRNGDCRGDQCTDRGNVPTRRTKPFSDARTTRFRSIAEVLPFHMPVVVEINDSNSQEE